MHRTWRWLARRVGTIVRERSKKGLNQTGLNQTGLNQSALCVTRAAANPRIARRIGR
jgi:hypothetical protein